MFLPSSGFIRQLYLSAFMADIMSRNKDIHRTITFIAKA